MSENAPLLPVTAELQQIINRFLQEYELRFEQQVANVYEFLAINPVRVGDDQTLSEDDFTAYVAASAELPILTNRHLQPSRGLLSRCQALGFRRDAGGYVPVLEHGPGILLAHYDPFVPVPTCFHPENMQVILCSHSAYLKLQEAWNERYQTPTEPEYAALAKPLPTNLAEWTECQMALNPGSEEIHRALERIRQTVSFEDVSPEWEHWFQCKQKKEPCISISIVDFRQESKKVITSTLKALESVILFENARVIQLGYVLDWDRFNNLEAVTEQLRRQDMQVQLIQILPSEYIRFIEDQVNKTIQIGKFIKKEDTLPDNIVDEIDPTQFTEEDVIKESDAKIRTIAEAVIFAAYKRGASDILIEPQAADYRIRLTIDGLNTVFFDGMPKNYGANIVAHLKVRASMSITDRRLPQDGKITLHIKGSPVELRAATMPVRDTNIHQEEKITLRLLSSATRFPSLDRLGVHKNHLDLIRKALAMANGIIIVTGPTGSGKTTTLYTAIQELDRERLNVVSLEDPIESFITGITQTQINEAIGLSFAHGLRATLRQAPHVILLGEVRDKEVAHIAVQAANTGHLVLTTLHTNSAIGTFDRLQALGVESHQIADAVRLIMAQRLVPRLCPVCRKSRRPTEMEQIRIQKQTGVSLNQPIFYANSAGCRNCHKGYTGRRILTELIPVDSGIRDMILKGQTHSEITRHAAKYFGYRPLMAQAVELVNEGQVDLRDAQKLFLDFYHSSEEKAGDQATRNVQAL